ncbi:hypothetical protein CRE_27630 [Caenorhabditis remanei]|nr:hypothetical protein CRE_27630 [Caenorhabditis remanei]
MILWKTIKSAVVAAFNRFNTCSSDDQDQVEYCQAEDDQFEFVRQLGEGAFGTVVLVKNTLNPNLVYAMKEISKKASWDYVKNEWAIHCKLTKLSHNNIIAYIKMRKTPESYKMFMEYATVGDLWVKIPQGSPLPPVEAQSFFKDLISGLNFMHSHGIVHRDIKPGNLLITVKEYREVLKITDFGWSTHYLKNKSEILLTVCGGSHPYIAPECFNKDHRGPPIDIWAAGIVLINMLTSYSPWSAAKMKNRQYKRWLKRERGIWNSLDELTIGFIRTIVESDSCKRATISEIEASDWYKQNFNTPAKAVIMVAPKNLVSAHH